MLQFYSYGNVDSLSDIDIVSSMINELNSLDKNGDRFRYPTSYSLEYFYQDKEIDVNNIFEYMMKIINYLDCCDAQLYKIAGEESDHYSYYYQS